MSFVQNDHVVQTLSADAADDPFAIGVLPGRAWCSRGFFYSHALDTLASSYGKALMICWAVQLASLRTWEQDFSRRPCHVYVMLARCYAQTELYRLTGEDNLLNMSHFMRNELLKRGEGGMLVTGSCSEGEHFTYNQNGRGASPTRRASSTGAAARA